MPEKEEYITKIMKIPDRLMIFLLYFSRWNCNGGPGAMTLSATPAPPAPPAPLAPPAPPAPLAPPVSLSPPAPPSPPGTTGLGVANLQVIYFCNCQKQHNIPFFLGKK